MKTQRNLLVALVSITLTSYAVNNNVLNNFAGKIKSNAVMDKEIKIKPNYKLIAVPARVGGVIYQINGDNCSGAIDINRRVGVAPMVGGAEVTCTFS